jgi:nucleoside-diphosphate-sugar epimerase
MSFDDGRARDELGYKPRAAVEALESSARWFVETGAVSPRRRAKISWSTDR